MVEKTNEKFGIENFSKINPQKAYNITYKYYLKSIFDNINNDIKDTLNKYEKNYTYIPDYS